MANQVIVTSNNTVQVSVEPTPQVQVTISRTAIGTIANVPTANFANFAGNVVNAAQPNITSIGNLTNLTVTNTTTTGNLIVLGNLQVGNLVANTANYANFAGNAFAVAGANVSGTVANATFATSAGSANTANSATVANSANSVAGANVSGTVANAAYADNAGNANFANSATVANSANSVTLANVSGAGNIASINLDGNVSNLLTGNGTFVAIPTSTANANYANFAGNAFAVDGANVNGAVANATFATSAGSANTANTATVANSANSVTLSNVSGAGNIASINLDGNVANVLKGNGTFGPEGSTGNANYANFAGTAFSVSGSNVSGAVANATFADNAGNANIANTAYAVSGANVSGAVANATYANDAGNANIANTAYSVAAANVTGLGNIATINLDGNVSNLLTGNGTFVAIPTSTANANYANFAGNAFSVDGGNVVGAVANATFALDAGNANIANIAYSVDGANVSGTVANATFALDAGNANIANTAYSVSVGNVSGIGNIATINLDGNVSNLLTGNGTFVAIPTSTANANYANFAGTVLTNAQPNITSVGNLTSLAVTGNVSANAYQLTTSPGTLTAATGQMVWSAAEQTMNLGMNYGVTQQVGLETYILIKASATINDGQVVMFTGANGDNVTGAPADTTSVGFRPEYIIGVATQNIANNDFGYVTVFGVVQGLNTNAYNVGDILWVDNTTPGALTATRPSDPNYQIEVAAVTKKSGGDGRIQVRVTAFNDIDSLTDVTTTTPSNGQALVYSGNIWVNGNPEQANIANIAYSVAAANVSGLGNIATINLDGNVSNLLTGNGTFVAIPTGGANANYANFAGTVLTNAQPNITSVGNLSALTVTGNLTGNAITWSNLITYTGNTAVSEKILVQADLAGAVTVRNLTLRAGSITNVSASNTTAGGMSILGGGATSSDAGNVFITRSGSITVVSGIASSANGAAISGSIGVNPGAAFSNNANATSGAITIGFSTASASNGNAIISNATFGGGTAGSTGGNAFGGTVTYRAGSASVTTGSGIAQGGNIVITSGTAQAGDGAGLGNSFGGNITIVTGTAIATSGDTATVGSININTGTGAGGNATVLGNINIGNSGAANAVNIGAANTPVNVTGNLTANIANANYLYGDGSNITGIVATNANYANFAGNAFSVDAANVVGLGNIATINLDGNVSNLLTGNGTFVAIPTGGANANYANFAGDVVNSAQSNITSLGTLTGLTVSGTSNVANTQLNGYQETTFAIGNVSGTITPDFNNGSIQSMTLTGNITLNSLGNAIAGRSMTLILTQDGTGGRTLTSSMLFAGASKTLSTAAAAIDVISLFYDGTTYYASLSKGYA